MRLLSVLVVALATMGTVYSDCTVNDAAAAALDPSVGPSFGGNAVTFNGNSNAAVPGTAPTYDFNTNGIVQTNGGQNLVLTGTMIPKNGSSDSSRYSLRAAFVKTTTPSDIKKELQPSAYVDAGGNIDPNTWSFYQIIPESSEMVGIDNKLTIELKPNPTTALQVGVGANGKNTVNGASGWFQFSASDSSSVIVETGSDVVDININLGCSSIFVCDSNQFTITTAAVDTSLTQQSTDTQALFVSDPAPQFGNQQAFEFVSGTNNYITIDQATGNIHLVGRFVSKSTEATRIDCGLNFYPFIPSNGYMNKQELEASAYVNNGGKIDPNLWAYYTVNTSSSSCSRYNTDGTVAEEFQITGDHDNMGLQFGFGASGKNGNLGLSVWLNFDSSNPNFFFDINVDTTCETTPNTALPETSPPETTPPVVTTAPPATCPPGCVPIVPIVNVTVAPTETPAAGNGASNIELSKVFVAALSLIILAIIH